MSMLVLLAGIAVAGYVLSRLIEFTFIFLWVAGAVAFVAFLAFIGGQIWGWGGVVALICIAVSIWRWMGSRPHVPPTGRYGYEPGDIMPPSPKRSDGTPY